MSRRPITILLIATLSLASCSVLSSDRKIAADQVAEELTAARADLSAGDSKSALERARVASNVAGLSNATRGEVQRVLERAAIQRIQDLSLPGSNPRELKAMLKLDLPRQIAVQAGVRGARLYYEQDKRQKAFQLIETVDERYPNHSARREAGALLADVGLSYASDPGRYWLFFRYRSLAPAVLKYLVDNYPSEPRCDDAYWALAELYEDRGLWDLAIENHEDLILWRPDSPLVRASQARIPHLRLRGLASPEYDRDELQRARGELETWLGTHPDDELEESVRRDLADCIQRLADNDLSIARFYARVDNAVGARQHALRALDEAREVENGELVGEIEALLADLDALETP